MAQYMNRYKIWFRQRVVASGLYFYGENGDFIVIAFDCQYGLFMKRALQELSPHVKIHIIEREKKTYQALATLAAKTDGQVIVHHGALSDMLTAGQPSRSVVRKELPDWSYPNLLEWLDFTGKMFCRALGFASPFFDIQQVLRQAGVRLLLHVTLAIMETSQPINKWTKPVFATTQASVDESTINDEQSVTQKVRRLVADSKTKRKKGKSRLTLLEIGKRRAALMFYDALIRLLIRDNGWTLLKGEASDYQGHRTHMGHYFYVLERVPTDLWLMVNGNWQPMASAAPLVLHPDIPTDNPEVTANLAMETAVKLSGYSIDVLRHGRV